MFIYRQDPGARPNKWMELFIRGWRVGKVWGIEVRLHLVLIVWLAFDFLRALNAYAGNDGFGLPGLLLAGVWWPLALFGSVFLHELGHCYGAWIVGGRARSILLWPLGGLAAVEGSDKSPHAELLVTILGPLVNLALAAPAHILAALMEHSAPAIPSRGFLFFLYALQLFYQINYFLFLFNMLLPIYPMDAGRILRASLALRMPSSRATYKAATVGMWVAGTGVFLSLFAPKVLERLGAQASPLLFLIFILGLMTCWQERLRSRFVQIYTSEDNYGGRTFYHDTPAHWRKVSISRFFLGLGRGLANLGGRIGGLFAKRPPKPEARVVPIHRRTDDEPASPKAKYFRQIRDLDDQLRQAVRDEDFARAEKIKEKIKALKEQGQ